MIFILYICLHKKRQNASCSFECENRVSTEKRQEMGEGRSESGQWRLLVINVPKRLGRRVGGGAAGLLTAGILFAAEDVLAWPADCHHDRTNAGSLPNRRPAWRRRHGRRLSRAG